MDGIKTKKLFIKSRGSKRIAVVVENQQGQAGLVFIMHGQGGFKEQPHIRLYAQTFIECGFTVVTFDSRDTIGESEGAMEEACISSYLSDLEDVIEWAAKQVWYRESFILVGHSAGSMCGILLAQKHPERVRALVPTSVVVSGSAYIKTIPSEILDQWRKTGWRERESTSKPGVIKRVRYSAIEDVRQYDTLTEVGKLTMPVLLIVGENDKTTPPASQKQLYQLLPGRKELKVIKGAEHTFYSPEHLRQIGRILKNWIHTL